MTIRIAFGQAGQFDVSLDPAHQQGAMAPALLVAHLWNMDAWTAKAERALELYARDRARDNERHIGDRCLYKTSDAVAYLSMNIDYLKKRAPDLMALEAEAVADFMAVCETYRDLQAFLQPILWTDLPWSVAELQPE